MALVKSHGVPADSTTPPPGLAERFYLYRERRKRGAKELRRLQRSHAVLFSPGNSGRTWLRVMLTRVIEQTYGLSSPPLLNFDNLSKLDGRIPAVAVTHNRWLPYSHKPRKGRECMPYYSHRVLILVRNPLDTCVSQYFQWKHRSKDANILLKGWPPRSSDLSLQNFLEHPDTGVKRLCAELATWLRESTKFKATCILRYEDLLADPVSDLRRATQFLGLPVAENILAEAVEYGDFAQMKQREKDATDDDPSTAQSATSPQANAHKARVGKTCGYVDYLSPQECQHYEELVAARLPPSVGYGHLPELRALAN